VNRSTTKSIGASSRQKKGPAIGRSSDSCIGVSSVSIGAALPMFTLPHALESRETDPGKVCGEALRKILAEQIGQATDEVLSSNLFQI